jgi:hypothetical protein
MIEDAGERAILRAEREENERQRKSQFLDIFGGKEILKLWQLRKGNVCSHSFHLSNISTSI